MFTDGLMLLLGASKKYPKDPIIFSCLEQCPWCPKKFEDFKFLALHVGLDHPIKAKELLVEYDRNRTQKECEKREYDRWVAAGKPMDSLPYEKIK